MVSGLNSTAFYKQMAAKLDSSNTHNRSRCRECLKICVEGLFCALNWVVLQECILTVEISTHFFLFMMLSVFSFTRNFIQSALFLPLLLTSTFT